MTHTLEPGDYMPAFQCMGLWYSYETKHAVEHISSYYDVDPKSEQAAYLQGEISKKLFPAVAIAVCPKCHNKEEEE